MSSVVTATLLPEGGAARNRDEELFQRSAVQHLDLSLPADGIVFAIPNGGKRSKKEAARLKGMGVKAGVSDLCVIYQGRAFMLELKTAKGVLSEAQRNMMRKMEYCGAPVMVCRNLPEVEASLRAAGVPLRGRVTA